MHESAEHAALIELLRHHPTLAARLVARHGRVRLPAGYSARVGDPAQRHWPTSPDVLIELTDRRGAVKLVIIVEVQRAVDDNKPWDWPANLWYERRRRRCDCVLLVIATDRDVAAWAARPQHSGPGSVTRVIVLAPADVPRITDLDEARASPDLAVLSAAMHIGKPDGDKVRRAAIAGLLELQPEDTRAYNHLVFRSLNRAAIRAIIEDIMQTTHREFRDDPELKGWYEYLDEETEKRMVPKFRAFLLRQLELRGIPLTADHHAQILACNEQATLDIWIDRMITATSADEIFVD